MKRILAISLVLVLSGISQASAQFPQNTFFILNEPSSRSEGTDFIDQYSLEGDNLSRLISPDLGVEGMSDLAFDPATGNLLYSVSHYSNQIFEIREIDSSGSLVRTLTHENFDSGNISMVFGRDKTLYIANGQSIYRRLPDRTDIEWFCDLPFTGIGDLEIDSKGNLYLSDPFINNRIYRILPDATVEIFADENDGINRPYGLAMDFQDNLYVGNSYYWNPAIIKLNPEGQGEVFAAGGLLESSILDLAIDSRGNLLAACRNFHKIIRYDRLGNEFLFADFDDGLLDPASIVLIPSSCGPDFDLDQDVDGSDLARFAAFFNSSCLDAFSLSFGSQNNE